MNLYYLSHLEKDDQKANTMKSEADQLQKSARKCLLKKKKNKYVYVQSQKIESLIRSRFC